MTRGGNIICLWDVQTSGWDGKFYFADSSEVSSGPSWLRPNRPLIYKELALATCCLVSQVWWIRLFIGHCFKCNVRIAASLCRKCGWKTESWEKSITKFGIRESDNLNSNICQVRCLYTECSYLLLFVCAFFDFNSVNGSYLSGIVWRVCSSSCVNSFQL